jgi:hypothetical protein
LRKITAARNSSSSARNSVFTPELARTLRKILIMK